MTSKLYINTAVGFFKQKVLWMLLITLQPRVACDAKFYSITYQWVPLLPFSEGAESLGRPCPAPCRVDPFEVRREVRFDPQLESSVYFQHCVSGRTEVFVLFWLGFQPDEEMSEIFKTEFQMRLLWGSKGAQVNQTERYEKFNQILTALSRKLEPPPMKQAELW